MSEKFVCPYCYGSLGTAGKRKNADGSKTQRYRCSQCGKRTSSPVEGDLEMIAENVRSRKQTQKFMDTNRIERKAFREHARIENAYSEYTKELISVLSNNKLSDGALMIEHEARSGAGIIQLSDLHFNELVDLPHNQYSFEVASKRLKRLAGEASAYFGYRGISNVLIAFTGDLLNSDRRMDELLSNSTNRSKATFLAVDLLQQFITEIATSFNVTVASVTGNEGRVDQEGGWDEVVATHNYDFTIHNMLSMLFEDTKVNFLHGDAVEQVVNVAGANVLMLHGHSIGGKSNLSDIVTKIIGKYAGRGIRIDYAIFGHIHEASIGDIYSRSSSLVGSNAYSEHGLNLLSRASQNLYVVDDIGNINGMKVDLQFTGDEGYDIDARLAEYNAKSADKLKTRTVVHEIVI